MSEERNVWKKAENGRWYRELGPGIVEYMTDMILKGKPEKKEDAPPEPSGTCPFKTRTGYHTAIRCHADCVFYNTNEQRCAFGEQMNEDKLDVDGWCPLMKGDCMHDCAMYQNRACKLKVWVKTEEGAGA